MRAFRHSLCAIDSVQALIYPDVPSNLLLLLCSSALLPHMHNVNLVAGYLLPSASLHA